MVYILKVQFPDFANSFDKIEIGDQLDPLSDQDITDLEKELDIKLPSSYKRFLKCTRGFTAFGGAVQVGEQHPFFHKFEPLGELTEQQQRIIKQKGGNWPPPSDGMLCFAEFFMEADGDQVLFDVKHQNKNDEYPIYYYSHDSRPPSVRKIADTFEQWLNEFPNYEEFATD